MKKFAQSYASYFKNRAFVVSLAVSFVMLFASFFINFYAGTYATERASNSVTDIILSNIPTWHIEGIFIYSSFIFWIFFFLVCLKSPHKTPFALKAISLFTIIRALFITLTHIGPFPSQLVIEPGHISNIIAKFSFGADLFFSGHTGLPFLLALIFWNTKYLRYIFLVASVFFGTVVLLAHVHYSIDVLSAFFITYTIFHMAEFFFKKDRQIFHHGISPSA